jgi:Cu(I)-responsive transcriptional regulator
VPIAGSLRIGVRAKIRADLFPPFVYNVVDMPLAAASVLEHRRRRQFAAAAAPDDQRRGLMNIGALAKRTGIAAKTIRYYESVGLLPPPPRSEGNYRVYGEHDVATLRFIQRARHLGFSLKEVDDLVTLWRDQRRASADVRALATAHLGEIEHKLVELEAMRTTLRDLITRCHGDKQPDCPIIDELAVGAE